MLKDTVFQVERGPSFVHISVSTIYGAKLARLLRMIGCLGKPNHIFVACVSKYGGQAQWHVQVMVALKAGIYLYVHLLATAFALLCHTPG